MRIPHSSHCTALLNLLWAALRTNTVTFACLISCSGEREIALLQHQYTVIFADHGRRVGLEMCDNDGGWRWNKNTLFGSVTTNDLTLSSLFSRGVPSSPLLRPQNCFSALQTENLLLSEWVSAAGVQVIYPQPTQRRQMAPATLMLLSAIRGARVMLG